MDVGAELHRVVDDLVDDDARTALVAVRRLYELMPQLERRAVCQARAEGLNWAIIGRLLRRSRQGLHRRCGDLE